ncbi:MAG: CAP domain-containing protein [Acidobacteria bacterium]|nr:CAP domain-containing protein [Acidobacteriota bacterium]
MFLALIAAIALLLAAANPSPPAGRATANTPSVHPSAAYDASAENNESELELLQLANRDRAHAGLEPLVVDEGLIRAARVHVAEMAAQRQLSHQFSGEPSLIQRIAEHSSLHLEGAGENVAMASTLEQAYKALMASAPHRDNLLSPKFNVAGFAVYRSEGVLYVAEDFGARMPTYSLEQAEQLVAARIDQLRVQAKMPPLERVNDAEVHSSACRMAQSDSVNAAAPSAGTYSVRYTSMQPETIPQKVAKIIAERGFHAYSGGACYARTEGYPNGAYWVVLVFH